MQRFLRRRWWRLAVLVVAGLLVAGGVAYATIPDGGGVYTACILKNVGTIRLIDPSLPASSLMSHCTSLETQISWNEKGQKGDTGPIGSPGAPGANGVSPTVAQLSAGDSHCPTGGAAITDANGSTAYICNGQDGQPGQNGKDFSGTFTSSNGQFTLTVADGGVQIVGPGASISMDGSGGISIKGGTIETVAAGDETVKVGGSRTETVGNDETITVGHNRTASVSNNESITVGGGRTENVSKDETITVHGNRSETVDQNETVKVGADRSETVGANDTVRVGGDRSETVGGNLSLDAALLGLNAGTVCKPVARVGDTIDLSLAQILTGSPDICAD